MSWMRSTMAAVLFSSLALSAGLGVEVRVDAETGGYSLALGGKEWFRSGPTFYTANGVTRSTADGSLKLSSVTTGDGQDSLGVYTSTELSWDAGAFTTSVRQYQDAAVFEQRFPLGVAGSSLNATDPYAARDFVSSAFPSLIPAPAAPPLGYLAFAGLMTGSEYMYGVLNKKRDRAGDPPLPINNGSGALGLPTGVEGFGPTCFYTEDLKHSLVVSAFSQFMAASSGNNTGVKGIDAVSYGVQGSITELPVGFTVSFIVAASGGGVNAAFEAWGDKLLTTYGKSREQSYTDRSLNYLGYSTDNGAFYYYQTEDGTAGKYGAGKTYEQTLIDLHNYAVSNAIPYRYILLDSWWYFKGKTGGVTNWVGRPDVFPHGNQYLRNQTGWPIMGHNRYWDIDNVYAKQNGGSYEFVIEPTIAWPSSQVFWDDLMYNSSKWGLFMYEQDWLNQEYDNVHHLNTNATAGRTWLLQMGTAAERNGITIQYCMSWPRHIMQSIEIPAVTNARASFDYHPDNSSWKMGAPQFPGNQWKPLGTTGIFAWAVGIAPTKDNFWSTDKQAGSSYGDFATIREHYNRLQSVVSTLSKGPVAPSDKIGRSDTSLILKSCASDGKLLQGDKPAMSLDSQHMKKTFGATPIGPRAGQDLEDEIWATTTTLSASVFSVVLGAVLSEDQFVSFGDLGLDPHLEHAAYESNSTDSIIIGSSGLQFHQCGKYDFQVWAVSPVLSNGWTLLGEPSKWVPVSAARFSELRYGKAGLVTSASVVASGAEGEKIEVAWLAPGSKHPVVIKCVIPEGSKVLVKVATGSPGECLQV